MKTYKTLQEAVDQNTTKGEDGKSEYPAGGTLWLDMKTGEIIETAGALDIPDKPAHFIGCWPNMGWHVDWSFENWEKKKESRAKDAKETHIRQVEKAREEKGDRKKAKKKKSKKKDK